MEHEGLHLCCFDVHSQCLVTGMYTVLWLLHRTLTESPYSSVSATYFLLAEAELQRKLYKSVQPKHPMQETLRRKLSVPDNRFLMGLSPR